MCDWIVTVVCVCVRVCVVPVLTSNTKYVLHLLTSASWNCPGSKLAI